MGRHKLKLGQTFLALRIRVRTLRLLIGLTLLAIPFPAHAQRAASNPLGGNLSVQDAGTCSTTGSFLWQTLPTNAGTTTVNLAGTFSGTVTIRLSNNGGGSWTTNSTSSSVGTTSVATSGFTDICADVTAFTSGTVNVTITTGIFLVQSAVGGLQAVAVAPSGSCTAGTAPQLVSSTGAIFTCQSGTWAQISGGGGGLSGMVAGQIPVAATATTVTSSVATSGSGNICLVTNCAMTTPNLGTPSAVVLTNATGFPAAIVQTGQTNVYGAFLQDFTSGTMEIPEAAGFTTNVNSTIGLDTTANATHLFTNNADSIAASEASAIAAGFIPKSTDATHGLITATLCDEAITTANTITCTDTQGIAAKYLKSTVATAGFADYAQGSTSSGDSNCSTANSICEQAPTAVTAYVLTKPGTAAQGIIGGTLSGGVITQGISGDANHSTTVTTGSGTSITSTQLCSTAACPVGTYRVNVYIDITTPCGTTGTYIVNLIYTDDQGSKTVVVNIQGSGSVPLTGVLTTTSTANFGQASQIIRSTGAASINYSTTATACGTAGPMVGKLYLSVEPVQ